MSQIIPMDRDELILILGENLDLGGDDAGSKNGTGKTLLINAISYALYGWPISDIKKEHLINRTNGKNMLVTIDFESEGKPYRIVRGLRPRILEFYDNGVVKCDKEESEDSAQGDSRETQKEIEKVLGLSHDLFCQIIAANTYTTPFLFQRVSDQRIIIEQLLGITLLSEKAEKLKEEIKLTKEQVSHEEIRIKAVDSANKRIQEQINSLLVKQSSWVKKQQSDIILIQKKISKLSQIDIDEELVLHVLWEEYNKNSRERSTLLQQQTQITSTLTKETKVHENYQNDLLSLKNQCCQTCKQKLKIDKHSELLLELQGKLIKCESEISELKEGISFLKKELLKIPALNEPKNRVYDSFNDAHDHRNRLMLLKHELKQKQDEKDPYQEQIMSMQNTALEVIDNSLINSLSRFVEHQEFLLKLLTNKDSFIRKKIIDQNLNYLNLRLAFYLSALGLPHEVIFQNDLSVTINEFGRDLSFGNLSRGEAGRLTLGLSFSFRDVWENLYQRINCLYIDELLDNGLDVSGSDSAIKLLREMSRDQGKSIWVVSHKDEMISKCDNILRVRKENGFTRFEFND